MYIRICVDMIFHFIEKKSLDAFILKDHSFNFIPQCHKEPKKQMQYNQP